MHCERCGHDNYRLGALGIYCRECKRCIQEYEDPEEVIRFVREV